MGLEKDDKIAIAVLAAIAAFIFMAILLAIRWLLAGVIGVIDLDTGGVGWRSAFISAIMLSFVFLVVFGLVAGDGLVGELGIMVVSFFIMVLFFTISIAVVL